MSTKVICKRGKLVTLRPFNIETDFDAITAGVNDDEINQFLKVTGPLSTEQQLEFFEKAMRNPNLNLWAIEDRATGKYIGNMSLSLDWKHQMGGTGSIIVDPDYWRKGFGGDAKMLVLDQAFNRYNFHRVNSCVIAFNDRSAGCLKKCGYKEEGIRREYYFRHGQYYDQIMFGVLQSDFKPLWEKYSQELKELREQEKNTETVTEQKDGFRHDVGG